MLGLGGGGEYSTSSETELTGDIAGKLNVLLTESDDESDFSSEGLVREEKLEEIMQELYREIIAIPSYYTSRPPPTVTLTSPSSSSSSPSFTSSPFSLSSLPFFAVSDVQSESCGASMSNTASTVMAGIEIVGPAGNFSDVKAGLPEGGNVDIMVLDGDDHNDHNNNNYYNNNNNVDEKMEGCDEGEVGDDDQWLARVLGGAQWNSTSGPDPEKRI